MRATWPRWGIYALLTLFAVLLLASLPGRKMHGDDAWLGEQAYWMSRVGYVRSDLFRGMLDYDRRQMVYHKLFIWTGAATVRIFGWSLRNLKAISLLFFLVFLAASYAYFRRNSGRFQPGAFWLFSLLVISAPLIFRYAFIFRPEMMLMTLGFLSFYFLDVGRGMAGVRHGVPAVGRGAGAGRGVADPRGAAGRATAAGLFAGLGLLTHLNGWIFIAAGLVILATRRALRPALAFAAGAAAASALYMIDLASVENLKLFASQMKNDLPIGDAGILSRILNIAYEPKRFFYSIREIFPSALLVLGLAFAWKKLVGKHREVLLYLAVLVVGLAVLSRPRPSYYIVLYIPYMALLTTEALMDARSLPRAMRYILVSVLAAGLGVSVFLSVSLIRAAEPLAQVNAEIASVIPEGAAVAAPAGFIFNQIGSYKIQSLTFYDRYAERNGTRFEPESFFALARSYGNTCVILDNEFAGKIGMAAFPEGGTIGGYKFVKAVKGRQIFEATWDPRT